MNQFKLAKVNPYLRKDTNNYTSWKQSSMQKDLKRSRPLKGLKTVNDVMMLAMQAVMFDVACYQWSLVV